jgi:hypothetical protein
MPLPTFHEWLANRSQEPPQADNLATLIAQTPAGISLDRLRRVVGLSRETLQDVLRGLVVAGQVVVLKVNGQMVYRVAG